MPWRETDRVQERLDFIKSLNGEPGTSFVELCRRHGISRKTGYKWVARYERDGPAGLQDAPPLARKHPNATDSDTVNAIAEARKAYPKWGPRKLLQFLTGREPDRDWPAASTVGDILKRQGLILPRRRRQSLRAPSVTQPVAVEPNDVWAMDFKGHFAVGEERCHPFTVTDEASRGLLCCEAERHEKYDVVRPLLERCFDMYGLPLFCRSDNGNPFGTRTVGGMSPLVIWLVQLGITPVRIQPGRPEQNGKHERMHRTLNLETPKMDTFEAQQEALDRFRYVYNEVRPHDALGGATPFQVYRPSARRPGVLREPEYDEGYVIRCASKGVVGWKGLPVNVGTLLNHKPIGIKEGTDDITTMHYGPMLLGYFDERSPSTRLASTLPPGRCRDVGQLELPF